MPGGMAHGSPAANQRRMKLCTRWRRAPGARLANSAEKRRSSRALGLRGLIRIPPRRSDKDRARFNRVRRNEQRGRRQYMQRAAKWTKPAIGSAAALTRRNAALVVAAIRLLAGGNAPQGHGMGVTYSPLPRDDKRDSEGECGQASAPSVHCFGSAKQRGRLRRSLSVNVVNERLSGVVSRNNS